MTTIAHNPLDPYFIPPFSTADGARDEIATLMLSCNEYAAAIQEAFRQLAVLTDLLLDMKEQLTSKRAEYDQLRVALKRVEELQRRAGNNPTQARALAEQQEKLLAEMAARATEIEDLNQRIVDPGSDVNEAIAELQATIEDQIKERSDLEARVQRLRARVAELEEEEREQAERDMQALQQSLIETDQSFADLLFSDRQGGVVPYETVLEWLHAVSVENLEADHERMVEAGVGDLSATIDSEGRSASTRVDAMARANMHAINDQLERLERRCGHEIFRLDVTAEERARYYAQDVVPAATALAILQPQAPAGSGLPLSEPLATPNDLSAVVDALRAGAGFAVGDTVARSAGTSMTQFAPSSPTEGEGWIFTGGPQHRHLLTDHANLLRLVLATMTRDFSTEGTDPRVNVMDCCLPPGQFEDTRHPNGAHAGGTNLDLGYYTTGATNFTHHFSPTGERDLVWQDNHLDTEAFDCQRNFALYSRIRDVFPDAEFLVHSEIRDHVIAEVTEEFGHGSPEQQRAVDMLKPYDTLNHNLHVHVKLGREVNWDRPVDWT